MKMRPAPRSLTLKVNGTPQADRRVRAGTGGRRGCRRQPGDVDHSANTPASSITGFQRSISESSLSWSACGVASSGGTGSVPSSAKRCATFSSASAATSASASVAIDLVRRPGRRIEAVPDPDLNAFEAAFRGGRNVGQGVQAFLGEHGIGLDAAGLDRVGRVGGLVAHEIDLAAHQVGHRRAGALVRHGGELRVERLHEEHAAQLRGGADAGVGVEDLILFAFT